MYVCVCVVTDTVDTCDRLGSVVVRALDLQSTGRGFDSRPLHCRVATLGKSFTRAQSIWSHDRMALQKHEKFNLI